MTPEEMTKEIRTLKEKVNNLESLIRSLYPVSRKEIQEIIELYYHCPDMIGKAVQKLN